MRNGFGFSQRDFFKGPAVLCLRLSVCWASFSRCHISASSSDVVCMKFSVTLCYFWLSVLWLGTLVNTGSCSYCNSDKGGAGIFRDWSLGTRQHSDSLCLQRVFGPHIFHRAFSPLYPNHPPTNPPSFSLSLPSLSASLYFCPSLLIGTIISVFHFTFPFSLQLFLFPLHSQSLLLYMCVFFSCLSICMHACMYVSVFLFLVKETNVPVQDWSRNETKTDWKQEFRPSWAHVWLEVNVDPGIYRKY